MNYKIKFLFYNKSINIVFLLLELLLIFNLTFLFSESNQYIDKINVINFLKTKYDKIPSAAKVYLYKNVIMEKTIIEPAFNTNKDLLIQCSDVSWLYVVDFFPSCSFKHELEIGVISTKNLNNLKIINAEWWPTIGKGKNKITLYLGLSDWELIENNNGIESPTKKCLDYKEIKYVSEELQFPATSQTEYRNLKSIIVCGHTDKGEIKSFYYDANDMYSLLRFKGVPESNIFYLGPEERFKLSNDKKIRLEKISVSTLKNYFEQLKNQISTNEKFLFFISTHGDKKLLYLENNNIEEGELKSDLLFSLLQMINCKTQFIIINGCSSGSFICPLVCPSAETGNRIVLTSCNAFEKSVTDLDISLFDLRKDRGSEFVSGFIYSFLNINESDVDSINGKVSILEAFNYAKNHACCADNYLTLRHFEPTYHPQIFGSAPINLCLNYLFND